MHVKSVQISFIVIVVLVAAWSNSGAQSGGGATVLTLNPGVRSYGLGSSGVADPYDPANAYCNPANSAFLQRIFLTGFRGKLVPDIADDVYAWSVGVAGGFMWPYGESTTIHIGGGVRFCRLDYGEYEVYVPPDEYLSVSGNTEDYVSITLAGGLTLRDMIKAGIGVSLKPTWIDLAPAWATVERDRDEGNAVAFDFGFLLNADLLKDRGVVLSPSVGVSYLNMGSDIEFVNADMAAPLPKNFRFGVGLRFESQSIEEIDDALGVETPLVTLAGNCDVIDSRVRGDEDRDMIHARGVEFGVLRMLFLRMGHYKDKDGEIDDSTYGVGVGITLERFMVRFDYASFPQSVIYDRVKKYGLQMGISF